MRQGGAYICSDDRTTKQKLHLSYKANEELIAVDVDRQYRQKGKMVVKNKNGKSMLDNVIYVFPQGNKL